MKFLDNALRLLTSKSPRIVCTNCNQGFLFASLRVDISTKGMKGRCPRCGSAGPFRNATAEEAATIAPEQWHWLAVLPFLFLALVAIVLSIWDILK